MSQRCPRCNGFLIEDKFPGSDVGSQLRCVQCGHREFHRAIRPSSPPAAWEKRVGSKAYTALRHVPVPHLDPPPVPHTKEDLEGADEIQCTTYAGYNHFQERAAWYRSKAKECRRKKEKLRNDHRARLCENLAYNLGRIYACQTSKILRDQLREQHQSRKGHPVKETNGMITTPFKRYYDLMLQAMVHMPHDPVVEDWAGSRKAQGDRKYLRKARKSLEKGVLPPHKSGTDALADITTVEVGLNGTSPGQIRNELHAQGLPARSREGIRKRLKSISVKVVESRPSPPKTSE